MAKWDMELCFGIGFTVNGIDAATRDEAIEKAKQLVMNSADITAHNDVAAGCLEYGSCAYAEMAKQ